MKEHVGSSVKDVLNWFSAGLAWLDKQMNKDPKIILVSQYTHSHSFVVFSFSFLLVTNHIMFKIFKKDDEWLSILKSKSNLIT
jgi:hypothetical protein